MSFMETMEKERSLMALSLLVAVLLWLFTFSEGEGEMFGVPFETRGPTDPVVRSRIWAPASTARRVMATSPT